MQRIYDSPEFAAAAKEAGRTIAEFHADVEAELKRLVEAQRREELRTFEAALSKEALAAAVAKFKTDAELKALAARRRADELASLAKTVSPIAKRRA